MYERYILPHALHFACSRPQFMKLRAQVVPTCSGKVLEVGIGSALNLSFYDPSRVQSIWGLEPSHGMRRRARTRVQASPVPLEWLDLPGESIPLEDNSVDTVLLTFTLCTIPDWRAALEQMHRVLKPEGRLVFCEHGAAPDPAVAKWQERLNPYWKKLAGGCHLNRPISELIESCRFQITQLDRRFLEKTPRFAGFISSGEAIPL